MLCVSIKSMTNKIKQGFYQLSVFMWKYENKGQKAHAFSNTNSIELSAQWSE